MRRIRKLRQSANHDENLTYRKLATTDTCTWFQTLDDTIQAVMRENLSWVSNRV